MNNLPSLIFKRLMLVSIVLFAVSCNDDLEDPPDVTKSGEYVDLRPQQSALKNQGNRTTCIVFAAVAGLEASYKRIGYGELDLSEEFINFTRKAFYLHPIWDDYLDAGEDPRETQLGSSGGGGGTGVIAELGQGFKIPQEDVMEYKSNPDYYKDNFESLRNAKQKIDEGTVTQRDYSNFNLEPSILDDDVLREDDFYSVGVYHDIADATDPDQIESVLKRGFEVVWDFYGAAPWDDGGSNDAGVWQQCDDCDKIAHAMLIVGFDKRSDNPDDYYFIVKNSWGNSYTADGGEGYTYLSYDYVKSYGIAANYIVLPNAPQSWPELAFIGRWKLDFDGFKGDLDIYHIPGMADYTFESNFENGTIPMIYDDYRIGTFYDSDNKAYRVNGFINGNRIEFFFDNSTPLLRWDKLQGRRFVYYLDDSNFMAGYHTDGDGSTYGGYARKDGYLPGGMKTGRPFTDQSYFLTTWDFYTQGYEGTIEFTKILTKQGDDYYLLEGTYTPDSGGGSSKVQLKIMMSQPNKTYIQIANMGDGTVGSFIGRHLSWEDGLITGNTPEYGTTLPFYMVKIE